LYDVFFLDEILERLVCMISRIVTI
jgi:hypothetical protein